MSAVRGLDPGNEVVFWARKRMVTAFCEADKQPRSSAKSTQSKKKLFFLYWLTEIVFKFAFSRIFIHYVV